MNADAFFVTGHTHTVCQDYAAAGRTPAPPMPTWPLPGDPTPEALRNAFGLVSDGCSTSPNTDFGSRFLVCHAIDELRSNGTPEVRRIRPLLVLDRAEMTARSLRLNPRALDATLLAVHQAKDEVVAQAWGDGVIAARSRFTGGIVVHQIEFPTGAPMYLNYWTDLNRLLEFMKQYGPYRKVTTTVPDGTTSVTTSQAIEMESDEEFSDPIPVEFRFPREEFDVVAVMSDGVGSFKRRAGNGFEGVPVLEVVHAMMALKGLSGEFVVRRMKAFLRQATHDGMHWDDDVAMAAVHTGEFA